MASTTFQSPIQLITPINDAAHTSSSRNLIPLTSNLSRIVTSSEITRRQVSTDNDTNDVNEASRLNDATVPDGGYGWVIVAACATLCFWFVGTTYSWGVIQAALIEKSVASTSTLPWVGSLAIACNAAFALPNSRLLRSIGVRRLAYLGLLCMGSGQILSGFTENNIGGLFITAGLLMGYGVSACFMSVSVLTSQYFYRRRGLANGLVFAGGGLGGAVISMTMSAIVQNFGTAWTFRFVGCLMLATGLPMAYLIKERTPVRTATFIDWTLFRDWRFLTVFTAGAIATFPLCVPVFFLPLYARTLGYSAYTGATLVAGFNFSSAVGRIICGFGGDKLGPLNSLIATLTLNAVSMLCIWPVSSSLGPLVAFVILNGMGNGGFFAIMPTVASNIFGSSRVAAAMSAIVTSWTAGYLMGAPIAGYLLDGYGGETAGFKAYRPAILYAGSLALLSALIVAVLRLRLSHDLLKRL